MEAAAENEFVHIETRPGGSFGGAWALAALVGGSRWLARVG